MNESERFAKTLSEKEAQALLSALQTRFEAHPQRHLELTGLRCARAWMPALTSFGLCGQWKPVVVSRM